MANRRLNKKVALIGSAVVFLFLLAAILVILQLGRDPEKYIKNGEAALLAARAATDEETKDKNYDRAVRSFKSAYGQAKTDALREDVLFKLLDVCIETQDWPLIVKCWDEIIKIEPGNIQAQYGRLKYFYILADSGADQVWQDVYNQADEFLKVVQDAGLLMENTADLEIDGMEDKVAGGQKLGPYLYLVRGRAALEMASLGAVINKDEYLERAVDDLKKVQEYEPDNIDAYWYQARAAVTNGELYASMGNFEQSNSSTEQARSILEKAVEFAGAEPRAHINLLTLKLMLAKGKSAVALKERIASLEPEYQALLNRFGSSAEAYAAVSQYYSICSIYSGSQKSSQDLDKAIEAAEQSIRLDKNNVAYAINASNMYYRRFSAYGNNTAVLQAIEIAKNALDLPDAQDTLGPQHNANINNRYLLYAFLANCYIEQILNSSETTGLSQTESLLTNAEQVVHEIEQLFGSGDESLVLKWQGMLELAKGNKQSAVRKLYTAYEQLKAVKPPWTRDIEFAHLSYTLAEIFKDTSEVGVVNDFLLSALYSGIDEIKPEARLDYVDVILKFGRWTDAIQNINAYEEYYGSNQRSRELSVMTHIGARQFDEADKELSGWPQNDPVTIKYRLVLTQAKIRQTRLAITQKINQDNRNLILQEQKSGLNEPFNSQPGIQQFMTRELEGYWQLEAELVEKLFSMEPDYVDEVSFINVCRNSITQGDRSRALRLVEQFLRHYPGNSAAMVYRQILSEPKPGEVPEQRFKEIEEQVLMGIVDPLDRAVELGKFYRREGDLEKATAHLQKAIQTGTSREFIPDSPEFDQMKMAADNLFEIALETKDWEPAEEVVKTAMRYNLDLCEGKIFSARLAFVRGEYKIALATVDESLKIRPLFSYAYLLRSNINAAIGDEHACLGDIRKAASISPLDGNIAKGLAIIFYQRNQTLGDNVTSTQISEVRDALERAIALNPGDLGMLGLYADYIAATEPMKAIAIRQDLLKAVPSVDNYILLGKLATEVARKDKDPTNKETLFSIAGSAFEQARKINPNDQRMLYYYANYFRALGQDEKAKNLLEGSKDEQLLWNHYFQSGKYESARKELEQQYNNGNRDIEVVEGLLLIAEKIGDKDNVKRYSEELLTLENNAENQLVQIQSFLKVGLVNEAQNKFQSFKEKYPDDSRILLLEAWLLMRQGQLDKALASTNKNLQNNPDNPAALRLRGEINFFRSDYGKAISDLNKSKLLSDEPATRVSLAKVYMQVELYEDAITELRNTIDAPDAPLEVRYLLEHIYIQLDRKQALRRLYEETLEKFPDSVEWLNRAGEFAIETSEFDKAEQLYKKAFLVMNESYLGNDDGQQINDSMYLTAFDGYLNAMIMGAGRAGTSQWNPDKLNKVIEESGKYLTNTLAPIAYLRMAQAKSMLGDRQKAVEYCRQAVDKAGTNQKLATEALHRMFLILGADEVSNFCRQKLQTNPGSLVANYAMFNMAAINAEYDKAIDYISKCVELTGPDDPKIVDYTTKKADILILAYEKSSDKNYLKTAITDYESLLSKMPNNTGVLNNLAYILAENDEKLPEALVYAKRALDAKPNNPGLMDTYAYVLHKNGKDAQAAEFLEAALQQYEQNNILVPAEVYEHKGMIKEKLGAKNEAVAAYRQALKDERLSQNTKERINRAIEHILQ